MKNLLRTSLLVPALALGSLLPSSCVAAAAGAAGAAGYAWYSGEFQATLDASTKEVADASRGALEDLGIRSIQAKVTEIDGKVTGITALDKDVTISIKRLTESTSEIGIRIGTWGDEELSRNIYEKIRKRL